MVAEHHFLFRNSVYVWLSPVYVWLFQWNREIFSRSSTILHIYIYITFGEIVFYLHTYLGVKK